MLIYHYACDIRARERVSQLRMMQDPYTHADYMRMSPGMLLIHIPNPLMLVCQGNALASAAATTGVGAIYSTSPPTTPFSDPHADRNSASSGCCSIFQLVVHSSFPHITPCSYTPRKRCSSCCISAGMCGCDVSDCTKASSLVHLHHQHQHEHQHRNNYQIKMTQVDAWHC